LLSICVRVPVGFIKTGRYWAARSSGVLYFFHERRISMSTYLVKGKGWRFDFILKGTRYTEAWFKTKTEALKAEAKRKEEILNPKPMQKIQTDIGFLELVNKRLDYVKAYNSEEHYHTYLYLAKRWIRRWGDLSCGEITQDTVQDHILERSKISAYTANKDLRYLRATFNFGLKKKLITSNPTERIEFLPLKISTK
jgi:hypothetical protein